MVEITSRQYGMECNAHGSQGFCPALLAINGANDVRDHTAKATNCSRRINDRSATRNDVLYQHDALTRWVAALSLLSCSVFFGRLADEQHWQSGCLSYQSRQWDATELEPAEHLGVCRNQPNHAAGNLF